MSDPVISRRALLATLGGALVTQAAGARTRPPSSTPRARVIDCHAHLRHRSHASWRDDDRKLIEAADKLGIDQLCCSLLTPVKPATAEQFRECNQWVAEGMRRFPGRVLGYCFVNPGYGREALDEIRRCIEDRGFIGVKLYNDYRANEPVVWPVVELTIKLRVPILHHAGHPTWLSQPQPHMSDGGHLVELADRYPEAMLICGHLGGGGDWEWTIKALRNGASVYLDTSGTVIDEGMIEMATRMLGADRILFGCDMSMTAGIGKIRAVTLAAAEKDQILGTNMQGLLSRRGTA
ncbi:MAG: amidohydrolase family protein [Luteitalea sp.]|nr:amidohydrolase family protein [Luteitalea sp.]